MAPQPIKEEYLLTDSLELTNCGMRRKDFCVKLIEAINKHKKVYFMPTNLYGPMIILT